jgi:2-dehydropantoate 2-reductase
MSDSTMPIAVIGTGTVGSILAAHLLEAGYDDLILVDVPERIAQIRERGLRISGLVELEGRPEHLVSDLADLKGRGVRTAIIAAKVTHLPRICVELEKVHEPGMMVVSFQNGIGTENYLGKRIDPESVVRGIVNFAGVRDEDTGDIGMSWFHPPNFFGPFRDDGMERLQELAGLLTEVGLESRAVPRQEMKRQAYFKTVLNSALNALCATTGLTMSEAMSMKQTRLLARELIREGLSVATQMGYHFGEDVLETCIGYLDKGGNHYPSMWQDLQRGRRTEIDFINGKIVKIGMMYGHLKVPLNQFFTTMVMTQEIRSGVRARDEIPPYLGCPVKLCY